ncbi:telomerase Cajal body protein 1 [Diachasma alloeum]|uniref:telomerase Cajal body protein 1 n=1 Tax=Diachasma alloeum TaxID=454923 RepID=UPI0007381C9B|nr:telomerase Cajal body protein 1 [Diachasma alloeum]
MEETEFVEKNSPEVNKNEENTPKDVTPAPIVVDLAPKEAAITQQMNELVLEPEEMQLERPEVNEKPEKSEEKIVLEDEKGDSAVKTPDGPHNLEYNWSIPPRLLCSATGEYEPNEKCENFTRGCLWSPDGTCLLVPADDFRLRVYELPRVLYSGQLPEDPLPPLSPVFGIKEGGIVYDCSWYPLMNSWEPDTCCFISTSKETPVHLWDAFTGQLRATYRAYNQVDEVEAAISVQFSDQGQTVWTGFKGALRSFDTNRPGRQTEDIFLKHDFPNVTGIVSCIRENPMMPGLLAFGTYSKCIGLYRNGPLCSFRASSGVTQVEFSPCGTKLYAALRRNDEFVCWDLRNPGIILYSLEGRRSNTNQRIQFSLSHDGSEIVSGGTDGFATVWRIPEDGSSEIQPSRKIAVSKDCVNGVNMHKCLPILATSSGQRLCDEDDVPRDNSVRLWYCGSEGDKS